MGETYWRSLTIKQPWAWAICHAGKDVENRTWPVPPKYLNQPCDDCVDWVREFGEPRTCSEPVPFRVMIHAGAAWDDSLGKVFATLPNGLEVEQATDAKTGERFVHGYRYIIPDDQPFSAVVAVATITGSHASINAIGNRICEIEHREASAPCSEWAQFGDKYDSTIIHHWQLADVTVLDNPVPARGWQKLWTPSPEIIRAVEAQL